MQFIRNYEQVTGQKVNLNKSSVTTGKFINRNRVEEIIRLTACTAIKLPIPYLGGWLHKGKAKAAIFDNLISKIHDRMVAWENAFLSTGGRLVLLKSVLCTLSLFIIHIIEPPKSVIRRIEKMFNKFLWGSKVGIKHIHWASWEKVCKPICEGGLGMRSLSDWIKIFSIKGWWEFRKGNNLWADFLMDKYCRGVHPSLVMNKAGDSRPWRRLLAGRLEAEKCIRWRLGEGKVSFWLDIWCKKDPLISYFPGQTMEDVMVKDFISQKCWRPDWLPTCLPPDLVEEISKISIGQRNDSICWDEKSAKDMNFSCGSAWNLARQYGSSLEIYNLMWHNAIPLSVSAFCWRLYRGWVSVDDRLQQKGFILASKCQCCQNLETMEHVFIYGRIASKVWAEIKKGFPNVPESHNVRDLLNKWFRSHDWIKAGHIRIIVPMLTLWYLWKARNEAKYNGIKQNVEGIRLRIFRRLTRLAEANLIKEKLCKGDAWFARTALNIACRMPDQKGIIFKWCRPQIGWFKLNTDGASRGNPGMAAGGGLIRNHEGKLILGFYQNFGTKDSLMAEMLALLAGLKMCFKININNIWVELDSLSLVQIINQGKCPNWSYVSTLDDIQYLLDKLNWKCSHIYREGNRAADLLANKGIVEGNVNCNWITEEKGLLTGILRLERSGLEHVRFRKPP